MSSRTEPPKRKSEESNEDIRLENTHKELAGKLASLPESAMRIAVLCEHLTRLSVTHAALCIDALITCRTEEIRGRQETLSALGDALAADALPYDFLSELYISAKKKGMDVLAATLLGGGGTRSREREPGPVNIRSGGRKLTLGERKSLARTPDKNMLEHITEDADPRVIKVVLDNPRIVEKQVVKIAARRPGRGNILAVIAGHHRWAVRPMVRRALVLNPYTPPPTALRLLALLNRSELRDVVRAADLKNEVRTTARMLLKQSCTVNPTSTPDHCRD